jgi:acyl-CoA reductase-like NAD-dependent aldehyde dehydrogenase
MPAIAGGRDYEHAQTLAELESLNCGKPLHCVVNDELPAVADVFRFFAGAAAVCRVWRRVSISKATLP